MCLVLKLDNRKKFSTAHLVSMMFILVIASPLLRPASTLHRYRPESSGWALLMVSSPSACQDPFSKIFILFRKIIYVTIIII